MDWLRGPARFDIDSHLCLISCSTQEAVKVRKSARVVPALCTNLVDYTLTSAFLVPFSPDSVACVLSLTRYGLTSTVNPIDGADLPSPRNLIFLRNRENNVVVLVLGVHGRVAHSGREPRERGFSVLFWVYSIEEKC